MNKCCLVNYKTHFTVYIFRVTNTDNIPYELYRNSESWFNPKLKTIPFFFEMEVTVRTLEACTKQQNRHTALPAFHPAPVPRDQTKRIQFDQGTVAWHCMIPIPAVSSDRAVPRKSREREREEDAVTVTGCLHVHGSWSWAPMCQEYADSSWPDAAAPRQGGRHSDSGDQQAHIFAIFLAAHSQPFHPSTKIFISNSSHVLCRVTVSSQMASRPGQRRTCSSSSSEFTASFKQKTVGLIARATAIYLNPAQYSMPDGALHAGYWRRTAVLSSASSVACSTHERRESNSPNPMHELFPRRVP